MLSAIAYVTLSTGKRPFQAINEHVNPVLGWGWILAVAMANVVWSLPQFALGTAALQQNLFPGALGGETGKVICCALILGIATAVIWQYDSGAKGVKIFEGILKAMVGVVVLSFFGVVITLLTSDGGLPTGEILAGFVPDLSLLSQPAATFSDVLARTGEASAFWSERIVSQQQDVMIAAAATAVGINMTFLLPYSMLRKGWSKGHRGLGIFDLATGLFIPFLLATSCVVIASSSQFHTRFDQALVDEPVAAAANGGYLSALDARLSSDEGTALRLAGDEFGALDAAGKEGAVRAAFAYLTTADRELAATLQKRDAFALADALEPLTGSRDQLGQQQFLMHYPHGPHRSNYFTVWRDGDWKVIYHNFPKNPPLGGKVQSAGERYELFNLVKDPFESTNVAKDNPAILKKMMQGLATQLKQHGAVYPQDKEGQALKPIVP